MILAYTVEVLGPGKGELYTSSKGCEVLTRIQQRPSTNNAYTTARPTMRTVLTIPIKRPNGSKTFLRISEPTGGSGVKKGY